MQKYAHYDLKGKSFHEIELQNERDRLRAFPGELVSGLIHYLFMTAGIVFSIFALYPISLGIPKIEIFSAELAAWCFAIMFLPPSLKHTYYTLLDHAAYIPTQVADLLEESLGDKVLLYSSGRPGIWIVEYPTYPQVSVWALSQREAREMVKNALSNDEPVVELQPKKRFFKLLHKNALPVSVKAIELGTGNTTFFAITESDGKTSLQKKS